MGFGQQSGRANTFTSCCLSLASSAGFEPSSGLPAEVLCFSPGDAGQPAHGASRAAVPAAEPHNLQPRNAALLSPPPPRKGHNPGSQTLATWLNCTFSPFPRSPSQWRADGPRSSHRPSQTETKARAGSCSSRTLSQRSCFTSDGERAAPGRDAAGSRSQEGIKQQVNFY